MKKVIPTASVLIPDTAQAVFHGQIFDVYHWPQKLFDGSSATFEMLKRPDTVVVICVVDDQVLVINDEQPHFGSRKSFPGGRVDSSDSSIEAAASREVHEETGYTFSTWRLIKVWQPHSKIEWFVYLLVASEVKSLDQPHLDGGEKITLEKYSFQDLKMLILNKTDYLGDAQDPIAGLNSLEEILELPAFSGTSVDR